MEHITGAALSIFLYYMKTYNFIKAEVLNLLIPITDRYDLFDILLIWSVVVVILTTFYTRFQRARKFGKHFVVSSWILNIDQAWRESFLPGLLRKSEVLASLTTKSKRTWIKLNRVLKPILQRVEILLRPSRFLKQVLVTKLFEEKPSNGKNILNSFTINKAKEWL